MFLFDVILLLVFNFLEKLRLNAEHYLKRIVELLFKRLPDFIQTSIDKNSTYNNVCTI